LLKTNNESNAIISLAKLFKQEKLKDYLKIKALSFESLSFINIIEILARISKKLKS